MAIPQKVILDFGMHEGEDTDFYLSIGARVLAFEANAELVSRNKERFKNEILNGQLEIVQGAIVSPDHEGDTVTFYVDQHRSVWGTTSDEWVERNSALGSSSVVKVVVPAIDLAALLERIPNPLYVKIDIEGADEHALAALERSTCKPEYVSIESSKVSLEDIIAEIRTLERMGYTRFAAVQQATIPGSHVSGMRLDGTPFAHKFAPHASGPFGPYLGVNFKSAEEVIEDYRSIFRRYRCFGDKSWLMLNPWTRIVTRAVNGLMIAAMRRPLCGWYDTHAQRVLDDSSISADQKM